jgi:hypothetical protein
MRLRRAALTTSFTFLLLSGVALRADAPGQMIRALTAKHKAALVTLELVVKLSAGGYEDQSEMEAEGVLLDASGLVVTTNSAVDPMAAYADDAQTGAGDSIASRVTSVKILAANGSEIPAKVVLRDKDLNLAFLRPLRKPAVKLQGVSLANAGSAQIGDPVYLLGRLGKTGNRSLEAKSGRVVAVMERPRRLYVLDAYNGIYTGNVAFNEAGQPLGILTLRNPVGKARFKDTSLPVIIPARDILEIAKQAPAASAVR